MRRSLLALALAWSYAASASANGSYSHVHISQLAHTMLPPGELRELLEDPELVRAYEAGSMFPDSGYAVGDDYGELAHWEPFLSAYIAFLRRTYGGDYTSDEARRHVAFLLGVASHGMADQSYDTTLLARGFEVDGPEPEGVSADQYADYFLVVDEGVSFTVEAWGPYADLRAVIAEASGGHDVSEETLSSAMTRMEGVTRLQSDPRVAGGAYWTAWEAFPFLGTHIYNADAVGSLPWLASLVADYWQVVWRRLHATDDPDADLVIRTVPEDGAVNWPVDQSESEAWGRIAVFFGYGVDRDQATPLITLRDEAGALVEARFHTAYGGRDRNLIFLAPTETLAHDSVYTVEVAAGVTTLSGEVTTSPALFSFRTRCAPDRLEDCRPLDPPLVTGPVPTRPRPTDAGPLQDAGRQDAGGAPPASGGCSASPSPAPPLFALAVALAWIARRRRRGAAPV